jgi:chromosome partitioning protein
MNDRIQQPVLKPMDTGYGVDDLVALDARASLMLEKVRDAMLAPHPAKNTPRYTTSALCALCGIDRARMNYVIGKGVLPPGDAQGVGKARTFSLAEVREWIRAESKLTYRPAGKPGISIVAANFKGGSTKTTTVMSLAQGLTLRGHRVLIIDLDPQASLTALCGLLPEKNVSEEHTIMPLIYGDQVDLSYAVQPTYWDGMDIIPSMPALFGAEFQIPSQVIQRRGDVDFQFWNILKRGIAPLRETYDVILFDTAPALSYVTINAMMAGDGLIMPLPPKSLDYASSTQFWSLFADLAKNFRDKGDEKRFDFISVVLSNVGSDSATPVVSDWIQDTYTKMVLPIEIPNTSVAGVASAQFGSVYDMERWEGSAKTYQRARQAYDGLVDKINEKLQAKWATEA